ncbi:MAG: Fic family protein [Acutalibacteraceae bacterium]
MYDSLLKIYHSDISNYNKLYESRFNSDFAIHLNFNIRNNQAFFIETPELMKKIISINKIDKNIWTLVDYLPRASITQFTKRCLIDEIVLSNKIEGVHSTRKEIDSLLADLEKHNTKKRFKGLVSKYKKLMENETIPIDEAKDIRDIYNELVLDEVVENDSKNRPDGILFRKESVSVVSPTGKEIHTGVCPENKIIEAMNNAIDVLKNEDIIDLFRISIFHYLFGYIHPFYDGNGRTSRFISSYLLSRCLEPLIGYRISYTIQENIKEYYEAFKICNDPRNKGDLTPFIYMFVDIIHTSMVQLEKALSSRKFALDRYLSAFTILTENDKKVWKLYNYLVQVTLFAEYGFSTKELMDITNESRNTVAKRLNVLQNCGILIEKKIGNEKFFTLDLEVVDKIILDNEQVD